MLCYMCVCVSCQHFLGGPPCYIADKCILCTARACAHARSLEVKPLFHAQMSDLPQINSTNHA